MPRQSPFATPRNRIGIGLATWRYVVPIFFSLVLVMLMALPLFTPGPLMPQLSLLAVYCWSVFRPALMPPASACFIGFMTDLWLGLPLGLNAALLTGIALVVRTQHEAFVPRPYVFAWAVAVPVIVVYDVVLWIVGSWTSGAALPLMPILLSILMTIAAYPLVARFCAIVETRYLGGRAPRY